MAKWQPPHPARQLTTRNRCVVGQRYRTLELLRTYAVPIQLSAVARGLTEAQCRDCGGYHLVNDDDLRRHRRFLVPVKVDKR